MISSLDALDPVFKIKVFELLARLTEQGAYVTIIDTLRTADDQAKLLAAGKSQVKVSKHQSGKAIDLAPLKAVYGKLIPDWDTDRKEWAIIGKVAESLDLVWGGNWKTLVDLGHVESKD